MHVFQPEHHACEHELGLLLIEASAFADMVAEITACQQVRDEVERLSVLERVVNIDQKRVLQLLQELLFTHDRSHGAFSDNPCF